MVSARQRFHTPAASREEVDDGLPRKPPYALPVPCIGTRKLAAPWTPDGFGYVAYACPMGIRLCLAQGGWRYGRSGLHRVICRPRWMQCMQYTCFLGLRLEDTQE